MTTTTEEEDDEVEEEGVEVGLDEVDQQHRQEHEESSSSSSSLYPTLDEVILGMQYASLAVTDDQPDTLKKVGRLNPWHISALSMITGSEREAHRPLSEILEQQMNLELVTIIDHHGINKGGHFVDTQGYIAVNDESIVLAFRCSTSLYDWLTNFDTTSSAWEIKDDLALGFSGYCSSLEGLSCCACCGGGAEAKPRVHTGCYNNILATIPDLETHMEPLLGVDQPPRKVFVVGHSLGAGMAHLAALYLLFQYDWSVIPQRLLAVTAGSPRVCMGSMRDVVHETLHRHGPANALVCRIVRNKDIVPTVPPAFLGFRHIGKLVYITQDDTIQMESIQMDTTQEEEEEEDEQDHQQQEEQTDAQKANKRQQRQEDMVKHVSQAVLQEQNDDENDDDDEKERHAKYLRMVARIPLSFRDHMPDFYMKPMRAARSTLFRSHSSS